MDGRLLQAAWNGDVDHLLKEIKSNPSILHTGALEGGENPLHVACLAGHLEFAATVVKLRQNFISELNQDGFSPLHIAAGYGHVNIVKEFLKVDVDLCLIEGKDRKVPLHLAVAKGKVEVIRELILSSLVSIDCKTAQGETSFHLAVKNYQFKALQVLVHHLKQVNKEDLLNTKDIHGNTILHLAVSRKQYEVVDFLLNGQAISKEYLEMNSLNNSGLTPLDMLQTSRSEAGGREIEELLIQAGALRTENLPNPEYTLEQTPNQPNTTREDNPPSPAIRFLNYFKYYNIQDSPRKVRNTLLVILVLITSATYQPALSPPGGTWQDDYDPPAGNYTLSSPKNGTTALIKHTAGEAIMGTYNPVAYTVFLLANSLGFFLSIHMISELTAGLPMRLEFNLLLSSLALTYATSMIAIAPNSFILFASTAISFVLPFIISFTTTLYGTYMDRRRCVSPNTGHDSV